MNSVSTPAMIRSSELLPLPLAPITPIFAPGKNASVNVLEHLLVGRVDLASPPAS